jgi:SAM-dependent methyltransferase
MPVETIAFFLGWLGLALAGGFLLFYGWNSAHEYLSGRLDPKHSVVSVTLKEAKKSLIRRIKLPKYLGSTYRCTVCGTQLSAFKPIWKSYWRKIEESGYVYPLSAIETFNSAAYSCPACDASDRERLYALYFDRLFQTFDHRRRYRLVDFAPSRALSRRLKRYPFIEYRSADLDRRTVDDRVDITDMRPYDDASIDLFLCSHILEHVPQDRNAMREMFRTLRPGALAVVMVPLVHGIDETHEDAAIDTPELRWRYYGSGDHIRQYGKADFVKRLTETGFRVDQLGVAVFGEAVFESAGIALDSVLYVAHKPTAS